VSDVIIGAAISTSSQGEEALERRLLSAADDVTAALDPERKESDRKVRLESLHWDAVEWLNSGRPAMLEDRLTFQWPLEFPEVFQRGGFDAIVGNPPFQGGKKISGALGTDYREHLVEHIASGTRGNADLVAYFFLRAAQLVRPGGTIGLLATNTISQGDTREVGLDQLDADGWTIPRAWKSRPWPGEAGLEVAQVWLCRDDWKSSANLDGLNVVAISPLLDPRSRASGPAYQLNANAEQAFIGSIVLGMGFVLTPEEARALIDKNSRNGDVIRRYLNGEDLNSSPSQAPSRWVIDFDEMTEDEARKYPDCWNIVDERVRPERVVKDAEKYPRMVNEWWKFWNSRPGLYGAISALDRVLVITRHTKTVTPLFVQTGLVYSDATVVLSYDDDAHFGLLSSTLHWWWAVTRASTLETRIRYNPTDCFETFPQPKLTDRVARVAKALDEHRRALMLERNEGLTKTYNRVHNPDEGAADIEELRGLHVALDHAVAAAYGWDDLDLDHGFHETPPGIRYTIGPVARVEVLDRQLELNHERYATEVADGLHDTKKGGKRTRKAAVVDQQPLEGIS